MIYTKTNSKRQSFGEAVGILLIDCFCPFVPGDVGNASTFNYPVRYKEIEGWTSEQLKAKDKSMKDKVLAAAKQLEIEGVRAITGDCGYMVQYQDEIAEIVGLPVFMSSLLQVPFISRMLKKDEKIGILCANGAALDEPLLKAAGVTDEHLISIYGLENKEHFNDAVNIESGTIDTEKMEAELVEAALELVKKDSKIKAILLECSMLPPYAAAIQEAVKLPVFDFVTMIDYVASAVVQKRYNGFY